ncbi:MAG TPA: MarR family transcriptional regulator [Pyrinomonadaceae bacterium]|jgi:DNA-binding MarR family transcriptional regulator
MTGAESIKAVEVLNRFAEAVSNRLIEHYQKHLAELDLTLPQAQALRILRERGACATGQLATELRISAPAVTQLTDRLLRKELIRRQIGVQDRRSVIVGLSEKGERLVSQFRRRRSEIFDRALAHLSEAEQRRVIEALEKVVEALETVEPLAAVKSQQA